VFRQRNAIVAEGLPQHSARHGRSEFAPANGTGTAFRNSGRQITSDPKGALIGAVFNLEHPAENENLKPLSAQAEMDSTKVRHLRGPAQVKNTVATAEGFWSAPPSSKIAQASFDYPLSGRAYSPISECHRARRDEHRSDSVDVKPVKRVVKARMVIRAADDGRGEFYHKHSRSRLALRKEGSSIGTPCL